MKIKNKKEPWRIIVFVIAVLFIAFMWIKKDIIAIFTTLPKEQVAPILVTTVVVSLFKVATIIGAIFFIKWIVKKIKKK